MTKYELEERLGYEVSPYGWEQLEKMYMGCDLTKDEFASLVKQGAKRYEVEKSKYRYKGYVISKNIFTGYWNIKDEYLSLIQNNFDSIEEAKDFIKRYVED